MKTVHIEFIADFICPWCYIGKMRLERIKTILANEIQLNIDLKPYILYPHIPKGGLPKSDFAKKTKPGMGRSLRQEAKIEGIQINYKRIERIPCSFEAHRLVGLVEDNVVKYELAKQIFHDYFELGQDIEDLDYLVMKGQAVGMNTALLNRFFFTDIGATDIQTVETLQCNVSTEFIRVVPSIRLDKKILIPGLQSADVWEKYIRRICSIDVTS